MLSRKSPNDATQFIKNMFDMMYRIDVRFVDSFSENVKHQPIEFLGRLDVVEHIHMGSEIRINGTSLDHYTDHYDPKLVLKRWIDDLIKRLGLCTPVFTGKDAKIKIGGKTIAVAKNVNFNVGNLGAPVQSNGRLTVVSPDDEET